MPIPAAERRTILLVALVQIVNVLDFVMVMPLGPDFSKALHFPESHLGFIGGSYTGAAAIAGLIASRFLDRFDRRAALAVCMAGLGLGTLAGSQAQNFETLLAARVLAGIFGGPATSVSMAIVADVVPPERRGRAMSVVSAAFPICSVLGIPAGLKLASWGGWPTPFYAVGALGLVITAGTFALLPSLREHLGTARRVATLRVDRLELKLGLITTGVFMFSMFLVVPNLSAFFQHNLGFSRDDLPYLYMAGGLISFVVLMFTGRLVDRIGATPVAVAGTVLLVAVMALGLLPATPYLAVPVTFVLFMCTGPIRNVPVAAVTSKLPAPHERAGFMSMQSAVQHLSAATAAFAAAQILTDGPGGTLVHMPEVLMISIAFAAVLPFLLWQVERRVRAQPPAAAVAPVFE